MGFIASLILFILLIGYNLWFNMLSMLGKIFNRWHTEIVFLFSSENRLWHVMQIVSWGKQFAWNVRLVSGKNKKNILKCCSAEIFTQHAKRYNWHNSDNCTESDNVFWCFCLLLFSKISSFSLSLAIYTSSARAHVKEEYLVIILG